MTDLASLGRRLVESPPVPPADRGDLERRWRGRRRRRTVAAGTVAVLAALGCVAGALAALGGGGARVQVIGPPVSAAQPLRPTALAVGPDGGLYVSDPQLNEILERRHDGHFVVVAGTGQPGFSGDGGPAVHARIDDAAGMAVGPDGSLYFADVGNFRVRRVTPDGRIETVAGAGHLGDFVASGTPAMSASFNPLDVAFGPGGRLYIATDAQVLRLDADGTLAVVVGAPGSFEGSNGLGGPALQASAEGPNGLAFDSAGDLYITGFSTKSLLVVGPDGKLQKVAQLYPRGNGGLASGPDGRVFAMDELSVDVVQPSGVRPIVSFMHGPFQGISFFSPNGIAVGLDGTIYVDTFYGNGFADRSAIAAISPTGSASSLLWQSGSNTPVTKPGSAGRGVLSGNGVGDVTFGQSQATAVASLRHLLGRPGTRTAAGPSACGIDSAVHWPDLDAYFSKGAFVGYSATSRRLATEATMRVGDALSFAQQLYGAAVVTSTEQGGAWFVTTPVGEMEGLLTDEPNRPGSAPRIESIDAGAVGCPAATP